MVKKVNPDKLLKTERKLNKAGFKIIAGVDEAGRGPLAGPVVASAVILYDTSFKCIINDSKILTPKRREEAYEEIMKKAVVGIGIVDENIIDSINIYQATMKAMIEAVRDLETKPDYVIVDGNMKLRFDCPAASIIKGDSKSLSIAAASIVAKVTRDRIMLNYHRQYPQYGFDQHKGYPTRSHKRSLKTHGPSPIHRLSFRPVSDLVSSRTSAFKSIDS
jgi:ribonuclease HII